MLRGSARDPPGTLVGNSKHRKLAEPGLHREGAFVEEGRTAGGKPAVVGSTALLAADGGSGREGRECRRWSEDKAEMDGMEGQRSRKH